MVDSETVNQLKKNRNDLNFLHRHIAGEDVAGMLHRDAGSRALIIDLHRRLKSGMLLAISHDSIISAILAFGGRKPDPWPEPLCGASIRFFD